MTGVFALHDHRRNALTEALPKLVHVRCGREKGPAWLVSSIGLLIDELTSGRPGFQSIIERAADMLFVDAWTVGSLARAVGLSRTVFAKRFGALVSSTVMDYVARQPMHAAAGMLASSGNALAQIANVVG